MIEIITKRITHCLSSGVLLLVALGVGYPSAALAERISLSGLKNQIDQLDQRLSDCEQGLGGACQGAQGPAGPAGPPGPAGPKGPPGNSVRNVITVALEGGDFTSIQAAIDSVPRRPGPVVAGIVQPPLEVTPTLIKIAPGEYFEQVVLRDNIRLQGSGRRQTIVQAPEVLNADCGSFETIICLRNVSNVDIADLAVSGANREFSTQADSAIAIVDSSSLRITGTLLINVVEGVVGEAVGTILLRDNDIPFPADAITLSMAGGSKNGDLPLPVASIIGNRIDGGRITLFSEGSVHILGNIIAGSLINDWVGKLHVSGNQIIGDVLLGSLGDSLFNNNTLLGSLQLVGDSETSVIGNSITGDGFLIVDNGGATIVGNTLLSDSAPISTTPNSSSTIFANRYEGDGEATRHNSLISNNEIRLESRDQSVTIVAGDSSIIVDSEGAITIDAETDISLTAGGKFSVNANEIELKSDLATTVQADTNVELSAGAQFKAEGSAGAEVKSGATTVIQGSLVQIN